MLKWIDVLVSISLLNLQSKEKNEFIENIYWFYHKDPFDNTSNWNMKEPLFCRCKTTNSLIK